MSHPTNLNLLDNERDTIEERENVLEEVTEPTDEELKDLEAETDGERN